MSSIRTDFHKQMGREAAKRCIAINGLRNHCDYYCPLNLRGDKAGKQNAAEFAEGWKEVWEKK